MIPEMSSSSSYMREERKGKEMRDSPFKEKAEAYFMDPAGAAASGVVPTKLTHE